MTSGENIAREVFAALDSGDIPSVLRLMTDDVHFRFGNAEPTIGRDGVAEGVASLAPAVASMSHELFHIWTVDSPVPVVMCEMAVTYQRHDGSALTLPCVDLFRLSDGLIADCRIYMDVTPVFAA
jgi:ketosteroid isomerase-like protein